MSTDIKPGQEVRAVRDTHSAFGSDIDSGTRCAVKDPNYDGGRYSVAEAGYTLSVYRVGDSPKNSLLVKPEDFAPAPLDPSKVKAGDTVTLVGKKAKVEGEVEDVQKDTLRRAIIKIDGLNFRVAGSNSWTLTAHQPAPEPEPEWKPGTVALISTGDVPDVMASRLVAGAAPWRSLSGYAHWTDEQINSVRPLVVIDPAAVDVDALRHAYDIGYEASNSSRRAILAVLATLGIEAP